VQAVEVADGESAFGGEGREGAHAVEELHWGVSVMDGRGSCDVDDFEMRLLPQMGTDEYR
jgi:hypothetical protein